LPVSLDRVLAVADLTTRHDRKYVVPRVALPEIVTRLPADLAALEINDRRLLAYESTYFDSDDHALYRAHVQGRRKRYKARTRSYHDTGDAMLEVKLKGRRGETVKMRLPYPYEQRADLTPEGRTFVELVVAETYDESVPPLIPVMTTAYHRATLVDLARGTRITLDIGLSWSGGGADRRVDDIAFIETKSASGPGPVDVVLRSLAVRPVRVSKYCVGVALLDDRWPANPWSRLLRTHFGWTRATEAATGR
jgi:hypothetical protein